jgi:predicted RNA-binding Zn-ribbon protein involved in translation (DUF1610 family)
MAKRKGPTPKKRHLRLAVIDEPEPGTRAVINFVGEGTVVMRGAGNVVMECGACGVPLIVGVKTAQIQNVVFKCPNCGAYNETVI